MCPFLEQDTLLHFLVSTWENLLIKLKMKGQRYAEVHLSVVVAAAGKKRKNSGATTKTDYTEG